MTESKTSKAKRPADGRESVGSPIGAAPLAEPKIRFRAVMREAAAARVAVDKSSEPAKSVTAPKDTPPRYRSTRSATAQPASARTARRGRKIEAAKPAASAKVRSELSRSSASAMHSPHAEAMAACYRSSAALVEGLRASGALWGAFAKANLDRGVEAAFALMTAKSMREMMDVQKGWTASSIDAAFTQGLRLSDVALDTTRKAADSMAEGADGAVGETKDRISA